MRRVSDRTSIASGVRIGHSDRAESPGTVAAHCDSWWAYDLKACRIKKGRCRRWRCVKRQGVVDTAVFASSEFHYYTVSRLDPEVCTAMVRNTLAPKESRMAIIGVGYIGYPLALLLASSGHRVLAVDIDAAAVADIQSGKPRGNEPSIIELASNPLVARNLAASTVPEPADVFIIAVPTPLTEQDRLADLSMVEASVHSIVPHLRPGSLVIVESTILPGTTNGMVASILSESGLEVGVDVLLAHCPERLHPGATLQELRQNDRIIGGINEASTAAARSVYETFVTGNLVETDAVVAELCKLFENTYRDVNIALANQMAEIAEGFGVDPSTVLKLASLHPRVDFLQPGIGVGGHCIPVDPWFLHQIAPETASMIVAAREVNRNRESVTARRIAEELNGVNDAIVVLAGAAYKQNVSDIRESSALRIAELLRRRGIEVRIHDPLVAKYADSLLEKVDGADLVGILVPHTIMIEEIAAERVTIEALLQRPRILDFSSGTARPF